MAIFFLSLLALVTFSQSSAPSIPSNSCNDVYIEYTLTQTTQIPPNKTNPQLQPYRFESAAKIVNFGESELKSWRLFIGFQNDEYLVSATNAVFEDGTPIPGNTTSATNVFAGFPVTDLKSAIQSAGDINQMSVIIQFVGTEFGVIPEDAPMPATIYLVNDGYKCPKPNKQGNITMSACCMKDPDFVPVTIPTDGYQPRRKGDLVIFYDILRSFDSKYDAQVSMDNQNPLGRLDDWKLSWTWMGNEFINTMRGAASVGSRDCTTGPQARYYKSRNFSEVLNCQKSPTFVDLPPDQAYDSTLGMIPYCCRNGTILPSSMDPSRSKSVFQIQVQKMPPYLNRTLVVPPKNFRINGTFSPDYRCGPARSVSPSVFLDSTGLPKNETTVMSWQVVCNIAPPEEAIPKCCVSFSAFYNESVIPCQTCACGCDRYPTRKCSATAPAVLYPLDDLAIPFANRSLHYAEPEPCPNFCGVSLHWHVNSDRAKGWSAMITIFNWGDIDFSEWFAAMQFRKAVPGFEMMHSLNGTALDGLNTIFIQGLRGSDDIVGEVDRAKPGRQQSIVYFTKEKTPGIDIIAGDKFPEKVFFNGGECTLPAVLPSRASGISRTTWAYFGCLAFMLYVIF